MNLNKSISSEEKEEPPKEESTPTTVQRTTTPQIPSGVAPTATPEVDEDGYSIQPRKETAWEDTHEKGASKIFSRHN